LERQLEHEFHLQNGQSVHCSLKRLIVEKSSTCFHDTFFTIRRVMSAAKD